MKVEPAESDVRSVIRFSELTKQHLNALLDLRNAELTRLNKERFSLIQEIDSLQLELSRRTNESK